MSWVPFAHTSEASTLNFWRQMAPDIPMDFAQLPFNLYATNFTVRRGAPIATACLSWSIKRAQPEVLIGYGIRVTLGAYSSPPAGLRLTVGLPIGPGSRLWGPWGASVETSNSMGKFRPLDQIGIVSRLEIVNRANCHFKFHDRSSTVNVTGEITFLRKPKKILLHDHISLFHRFHFWI